MFLKTHEDLLQFEGKAVQFSHSSKRNVRNKRGLLYREGNCVYLLNDHLDGSKPCDKKWRRLGYRYSWFISGPPFFSKYEEYDYEIKEITLIENNLDFNKLEELLCS